MSSVSGCRGPDVQGTAQQQLLEHVVGTPPSPHRKDSPKHPPRENPKAPLDSEEG